MLKKRKYGWFVISTLICYVSILQIMIDKNGHVHCQNGAEYMILLGASITGTTPSPALMNRIDVAVQYLKRNPQTVIIVSGGIKKNKKLSEAVVIRQELTNQGISPEKIIMEERAQNTHENIKFAKLLIPEYAKHGILVTNDFHMFRAKKVAVKQGLYLEELVAKTPKSIRIQSIIREYLAITKYWLSNQI